MLRLAGLAIRHKQEAAAKLQELGISEDMASTAGLSRAAGGGTTVVGGKEERYFVKDL